MKRSEKRGVIIGIIILLMGIVGTVYTTVIKDSVNTSEYMYSLGSTYIVVGILLIVYFIKLSKNKVKSDEQQNIFDDERINSNKNKASAITFKIIVWTSIVSDFVVTFFLRQYQKFSEWLNLFTVACICIYLVTYYFVTKKNYIYKRSKLEVIGKI